MTSPECISPRSVFLTYAWWKYIKQIYSCYETLRTLSIIRPYCVSSFTDIGETFYLRSNLYLKQSLVFASCSISEGAQSMNWAFVVYLFSWAIVVNIASASACLCGYPPLGLGWFNKRARQISLSIWKIKFSFFRSYLLFFCILPIM